MSVVTIPSSRCMKHNRGIRSPLASIACGLFPPLNTTTDVIFFALGNKKPRSGSEPSINHHTHATGTIRFELFYRLDETRRRARTDVQLPRTAAEPGMA